MRSTTGDSRPCSQGQSRFSILVDVANDFVGEKENRKQLFGKCYANDIPSQVPYFVKVNTNGKLEARTKSILDKCSVLSSLTDGPKRGGELMWAQHPRSFDHYYGPE